MVTAVFANAFILLIFGVAAILYLHDPSLYYRSAQEDRFLEWFTAWAFFAAFFLFLRNARIDRSLRGGLPWFAVGLGLFCLLVGLEEISWGQRLFGYLPPDYFLAQNFQQEFNLHNVVDTDLRMLGLLLVVAGYGVLLSLVAAIPAVESLARRWRIVAAPVSLVPAFATIGAVYSWYPASFTGEWVEAAMAVAFVGIAALTQPPDSRAVALRELIVPLALAVLASLATLILLRLQYGSDTERSSQARTEIAALAADFESPRLATRCNLHKRLYTFMVEYEQPYLVRGEFAKLLTDRGEQTRASYLLDPWNSPYWVRHSCDGESAVAFVYSFGPDRRRDSSDREIGGDDIGAYFIQL